MQKAFTLAVLMTGSAIFPATAAPAIALVADKTLVSFDTENPEVTERVDVKGVERLDGIDWQPETGKLIGIETEGDILDIDPKTGAIRKIAAMSDTVPTGQSPVIVDANPATGSLRFMTGTSNYRIDPTDGTVTSDGPLAYVANDDNDQTLPMVVAAAYTNSLGKADTTALYGIDSAVGALVRQTMPNDGALKTIGSLQIEKADSYAFDIHTSPDGQNTAWLIAGKTLHTVDLETGKASKSGEITGLGGIEDRIRDFSVPGAELKSSM